MNNRAWSPLLYLTFVLLALTLGWDATDWDLRVMSWLGSAQGFEWRHAWWLERVLHDSARHAATGLYLLALLLMLKPVGALKSWTPWHRLSVASGITGGLLLVNYIKRHSLTSCPWDLTAFGGVAQYVSHWSWGWADGGDGHCFPGGHASAALAFVALSLPWLTSDSAHERRRGWGVLLIVTTVGVILGATQTVRGAHYPSHTLWTWIICWTLALGNHALWMGLARWRTLRAQPLRG